MEPEQTDCKTRQRLENLAQYHLRELAALAQEEADILRTADQERILEVDKKIENTLGQKERVIGALDEHRKEHGC
jgi:hypothetical protein